MYLLCISEERGNLHPSSFIEYAYGLGTCHMASKACPESESSNSKILTSHGGSEFQKLFSESLEAIRSPENHGAIS